MVRFSIYRLNWAGGDTYPTTATLNLVDVCLLLVYLNGRKRARLSTVSTANAPLLIDLGYRGSGRASLRALDESSTAQACHPATVSHSTAISSSSHFTTSAMADGTSSVASRHDNQPPVSHNGLMGKDTNYSVGLTQARLSLFIVCSSSARVRMSPFFPSLEMVIGTNFAALAACASSGWSPT